MTEVTKKFTFKMNIMNSNKVYKQRQSLANLKYLPAVSILLPFQPFHNSHSSFANHLKLIRRKIEQQLCMHYTAAMAMPLIIKLNIIIRNLNYNSPAKSIAIFVSPVMEKVYYLEFEAEEKIAIDECLNIRDFIFNKKQIIQYLVMIVSEEHAKMYVGNCSKLMLIKSNILNHTNFGQNDEVNTILDAGSFSSRKAELRNQFLIEMDQGLSIILAAYALPVFLIGAKKVLEQFKNITKYKRNIIQYIVNNYNIVDEEAIQKELLPYEFDWAQLNQAYLLNQIEKTKEKNNLAIGINQVWTAATQNKGKLLIMEAGYVSLHPTNKDHSFYKMDYLSGSPFYMKDEVDEIIGKVLESGGNVEFVAPSTLQEYDHIVLIENINKDNHEYGNYRIEKVNGHDPL